MRGLSGLTRYPASVQSAGVTADGGNGLTPRGVVSQIKVGERLSQMRRVDARGGPEFRRKDSRVLPVQREGASDVSPPSYNERARHDVENDDNNNNNNDDDDDNNDDDNNNDDDDNNDDDSVAYSTLSRRHSMMSHPPRGGGEERRREEVSNAPGVCGRFQWRAGRNMLGGERIPLQETALTLTLTLTLI